MVIQTNILAMNANRQFGITVSKQKKSSEKLSSGFRINRAADDAAGLTISEKMRRQIRGLTQASDNAQDGISMVQTAEGAEIFIIDSYGALMKSGEIGEIIIRSNTSMTGYYNDNERTSKVYCQNPLQNSYREICLRTGDKGYIDCNGLIHHKGRTDFIIKRHGIRIELEELEKDIRAINGIDDCVCIFDEEKEKIILFYVGNKSESEIYECMFETIRKMAMPDYIKKIGEIPLNQNGKFDRKRLRNDMELFLKG